MDEEHRDERSSPEPFVAACRGIVEDVTRPSPLSLAERVYVAVRRRARWRWVVLLLLGVLLLYVACAVGFRARRARELAVPGRFRPSGPPGPSGSFGGGAVRAAAGSRMRGEIPAEIREALLQQ